MGKGDGERGGVAFLYGLAALMIFCCLVVVNDIVGDEDPLRFVAGDRPIYQFYRGANGSDEWLEWRLPAGGTKINVTYERVESEARRPAALRLTGSMGAYDANGKCRPRVEWDVSAAGNSIASGVLSSNDSYLDEKPLLPESEAGLQISISARRTDSENCAVLLVLDDLSVMGDRPISFLPPYASPKIFIADNCDDGEPCPPA